MQGNESEKPQADFSALDAVEIARVVNAEGRWRRALDVKRRWREEHPDRRYGPDICTTALLNPLACEKESVDWRELRPMLAEGSKRSFFGFCADCAAKIEQAGMSFLAGSLKEAIKGAQERQVPGETGRLVATADPPRMERRAERTAGSEPPQVAAEAAVPVRTPPAEPREPDPAKAATSVSDEAEAAREIAAVNDKIARLEAAREIVGDQVYGGKMLGLLRELWELEDGQCTRERVRMVTELTALRDGKPSAEAAGAEAEDSADTAGSEAIPAAGGTSGKGREPAGRNGSAARPARRHIASVDVTEEILEVARAVRDADRYRRLRFSKTRRVPPQNGETDGEAVDFTQCAVAANAPAQVCGKWERPDRLMVITDLDERTHFGFCSVCTAIIRAAGIEIGPQSLQDLLPRRSHQRDRGSSPDREQSAGSNGRPMRRTGKTARKLAAKYRKLHEVRQEEEKKRAAEEAGKGGGKPSKEERRRAKAAAGG